MAEAANPSADRYRAIALWLRTPTRLTIALLGGTLLIAIVGGYMPADAASQKAVARLERAEKRAHLSSSLAGLRGEFSLYKNRVPEGVNLTEWAAYLQSGVGKTGVRLVFMEPKAPLKLGTSTALAWQIELEGDFESMCRYIRWVESGERLMRVDRVVFECSGTKLALKLVVKGLVRP